MENDNLEKPIFKESNELEKSGELPTHFDVGILLSAGYKDIDANNPLDMESKIRCLAAGMMAESGSISELIIAGGKLNGEDKPSISSGLKEYILKMFPDLFDFPITLEEKSIDTSENADEVQKILADKDYNNAVLITSESHIKRATKLFQEYGLDVFPMAAEFKLAERSSHHKNFIESYMGSFGEFKREAFEAMFRMMMVVDRKQKILREIARMTRK